MLIRQFHHQRIPNYKGWWTLILETPSQKHTQPEKQRVPLPIPTESIADPVTTSHVDEKPKSVYLQGVQVELPKKPPPPDNCCMSGCAHW
ncbi:hypothetical protein K501DRAFT_182470 [Backusella circina FSU 941]|nr:hypothetical protein K501DRAFT_182470 [Backusella circina FSU 941]